MGWLALSAAMLLFVCWIVARAAGTSRRERFWIALAAAMLQLGIISGVLSLFTAVRPGAWIGAQGALTAVVGWMLWGKRQEAPAGGTSLDWLSRAFIVLIGAAWAVMAWRQWVTPINRPDELNYHASRAVYWMQHHSVLPFVTHNDRQVVFPFGAELWFFWPILFTQMELVGRMVFWLAQPMATLGVLALAREAGLSVRRSLAAGALFAATPVVLEYSLCLKNDLWAGVFLIGLAWWVVRAMGSQRPTWNFAMAGLYAALAFNVKTTSLVVMPVAVLAAVLMKGRRVRATGALAAGAAIGLVFSGLIITLLGNLRSSGYLLASPGLRAVVRPDYSPRQTATHAVRGLLYFVDVPILPPGWASSLSDGGQRLMTALGVDRPLTLEDPSRGWPGAYTFTVPPLARTFSLGGLLWLPCVIIASAAAVGTLVTRRRLTAVGAVALMSLPLLLAGIFLIRWNGGPGRFILGAYGMGLVVAMHLLGRTFRWPIVRWVGVGLIVLAVTTPLVQQVRQTAAREPWGAYPGTPGFAEAARAIPSGSTILLVAGQNASDYLLFDREHGYANRVISWGKAPFTPQRFEAMVSAHHPTHVLVQDDRAVRLHWDPAVQTAEMVQYVSRRNNAVELPSDVPHLRLFRIRK